MVTTLTYHDNIYEKQLFLFNTKKSPVDNRDWRAEGIYNTEYELPKELNYSSKLNRVRQQGDQGTCAAQTACCMKEWQENKDVNFNGYMSPQFIYNNRENQDTEGMYGRDVMRILKNIGSCPETSYPYNKIEIRQRIQNKFFTEAKNYTIKSYAQVHTIDALKRALFINGPCYIAFPVFNYGTSMWKQKSHEKQKGGHAMCVVGYNQTGFIIRNSWGIYWGNKGYCVYPYSDWGSHYEVWTTIDDYSYTKPIEPPSKPSFFQLFLKWLFYFN
jgi:hypothetical protein